jgi:sulfate adenylyltransferase subunit 1 (EFTu-like GTPase family)
VRHRSTTLSRKRISNPSTLIARLFCQNNSVLNDQLATLERDSREYGAEGENIDYSDGLEAEREHHH